VLKPSEKFLLAEEQSLIYSKNSSIAHSLQP